MPRALAIGLLVAVLAARARAAELEDVHPDERETIRELGERWRTSASMATDTLTV